MKNWWVPGLQIGYEHTFIHQVADFLTGLSSGKIPGPNFRDGLATVRLAGTVVTTDPAGREARRPFARRIVVLFGNWMPEVVDEELDGRWLSGGDLALAVRDHNFA